MRAIIDIRPLMERQRSGVGTYAHEMVQALARRGNHEYTLFANGRPSAFPKDVPAETAALHHRFSQYPNRLLNVSFAFAGLPQVERLAGPADALYLPNLNFIATKLPYVVTVHDLSFVRYPQFFSAKQRLWHRMVRVKRLLQSAGMVAAVSQHTKDDVVETFGIAPEKIVVVSPAADARYAPQPPETVAAVRTTFGLQRPYFLSLGALEPRKNVPGIIEAFEAIDADVDLVIAGGKGWLYEPIFERAARSPKRDRIRFLGYVPEDAKPALYAGAIALVYPSFYEGFGMPPLEAMQTGTPVIASNASSLSEVVGSAGILVKPESTESIAAAMRVMLEDEAMADEFRTRGLARAKRYSWDESAAKIEAALANIKRPS